MDVNTLKQVFGPIPIDQLPAYKTFALKKKKQQLMIAGAVVAVGVGIYIGYHLHKSMEPNHLGQNKNFNSGREYHQSQATVQKPVSESDSVAA